MDYLFFNRLKQKIKEEVEEEYEEKLCHYEY